jgi:hypothetical protein
MRRGVVMWVIPKSTTSHVSGVLRYRVSASSTQQVGVKAVSQNSMDLGGVSVIAVSVLIDVNTLHRSIQT